MNEEKKGLTQLAVQLVLLVAIVAAALGLDYAFSDQQPYIRYLIDTSALAAVIVLVIILYRTSVKRFRSKVIEVGAQIDSDYQQYMKQWEYPYAILTDQLRIVWCNDAFRHLTGQDDGAGKSLADLKIDWGKEKPEWDPIIKQIQRGDSYFRAEMNQIRLRGVKDMENNADYTQLYSLSLKNVTREVVLEQENLDQQSVVGLFYVDNYDQIMNSLSENQRPLLEAGVYRLLSDQATELKGVMTRLERDRFLVIFPHKYLKNLTEGKFAILDKIKKMDSGSRYQTTLSIGMGIDPDIETARKYARSGVDLAMGRGGDQAVIRSKNDQQFFGGMTTTVENNTRVRARLIAYALKERIEAADQVLVMGHANPDLDCFGAALGMWRIVHELKKPVHIAMSADKHPAVDYLYRRVSGEKDYSDVLLDQEKAEKFVSSSDKTLLIVVDVNRKVIVQFPDLLEKAKDIVVIDHHRTAADSIEGVTISYVEPFASSASEMVTELMQYILENPQLTSIDADGLFAGIALDTKNFTVKTGVRTFEAAAYLRRKGADSVRVRKMFKNDMEDYKAKARIVGGAEIFSDKVAIASWASSLPNASTVAAQAADELLDIHGIAASFVLTEIDQGQINISARSLGEFNVQLIMEELGGGGHLTMAGAQLKNVTLEEARRKLIEAIDKVYPENREKNDPKGDTNHEDPAE